MSLGRTQDGGWGQVFGGQRSEREAATAVRERLPWCQGQELLLQYCCDRCPENGNLCFLCVGLELLLACSQRLYRVMDCVYSEYCFSSPIKIVKRNSAREVQFFVITHRANRQRKGKRASVMVLLAVHYMLLYVSSACFQPHKSFVGCLRG